MSTHYRQERLQRMLFEELSIIIGSELQDPRLALAKVTDVQVSRDLRNVKVYVFSDDDEVSQREVIHGLNQAQPYVRRELATRCTMRAVPEVLFFYDESPQRAERVDELLAQIARERAAQGDETDGDIGSEAGMNGPMNGPALDA